MKKNTTIANIVTIGGVGLCLGIAQFPLMVSAGIMALTVTGCGYLTYKDK